MKNGPAEIALHMQAALAHAENDCVHFTSTICVRLLRVCCCVFACVSASILVWGGALD